MGDIYYQIIGTTFNGDKRKQTNKKVGVFNMNWPGSKTAVLEIYFFQSSCKE